MAITRITFANGDVADADDINYNFDLLGERFFSTGSPATGSGEDGDLWYQYLE